MVSGIKNLFQKLITESKKIKQEAWNCDHPEFLIWRDKAKQAVEKFAPIKLPTFNEISFASDFYLSKPIEERIAINDRIALVDDFNLAERLFYGIVESLAKEDPRKSEPYIHESRGKDLNSSLVEEYSCQRFSELLREAQTFQFSARELKEIQSELTRIELEFDRPKPNWNLIKRSIKFILDYDSGFAILALPVIFKECKKIGI